MSWFEFPHTRTYDSDLGWIIANMKQNIDAIKWLQRYAEAHQPEYEELKSKVDALVNGLVDVIEPWDSSVEYPIYSIVSYQGQNYIAIRPVPVGAMITNEYYWQVANTVVEQINAIGAITTEIGETVDEMEKYVPAAGIRFTCSDVKTFTASELFGRNAGAQGMCYNSNRDSFYIATTGTDTENAIVAEVPADFSTIVRREAGLFGHANDFTYNPDIDRIVLVTSHLVPEYVGKILLINPQTMALESIAPYTASGAIWCIAYDSTAGRYYIVNLDYTVSVLDSSFNVISTGTTVITEWFKGAGYTVPQTIEVLNGNLVCLCSYLDSARAYRIGGGIAIMNSDGELISNQQLTGGALEEPEGCAAKDGQLYFTLNNEAFVLVKVATDSMRQAEAPESFSIIPASGDLNSITTLGNWFSPYAAYSAALANTPVTDSGFVMRVFVQYALIYQEIVTTAGLRWIRRYTGSTWSAWYNTEATAMNRTASESTQTLDGYETNSWHYVFSGYSGNAPATGFCYTLWMNAGRRIQFVYGTTNHKLYIRLMVDSAWLPWFEAQLTATP